MKKLLLFLAITSISYFGVSQTVFINELHYDNTGADIDEGIEIAGPASTDLSGYSIELYNGSNSLLYNTIPLSGIIPAQDNGYGTINFPISGIQNGPDALALIDGSGTVVQFLSYEGVLTAGDGTAVGLTSTDIGLSQNGTGVLGESMQLVGVGSVYTDFTWILQTQTRDLVNTGQSFGGTLPPTVAFDVTSISLGEAAGTVVVNINITNEDTNPTSADVVLGVSTATGGGVDFTYTSPTTVIFPGSSTTQQTVSLTITDDATIETPETIVLELQNITNSGVVGNNSTHTITITDNDAPVIPACSELFFSEYMEGSSFNKALEIFNPTTQVADLTDYEIRLFGNGSATPTSTFTLSGVVVPGDVYVIAHPQAQLSIQQQADANSNVTNFNGDDAVQLVKLSTGTVVDVIGEVGIDPGTEWIVGTGSTLNNTLVRMSSVDAGTSAWTGVGDSQWDAWGMDDTLHIGSHQNIGCATTLPLTAYPLVSNDTVCLGDTVYFNHTTFGGSLPYNTDWDFGDGTTSNLDNPYHVYTTGGLFNVTFAVIDNTPSQDDSVFTVFVNTLPSVSAVGGTTICIDGSATLTATGSGGATPYSYIWSDGSTGSPVMVTPTTLTNYTVIVTDSNGCAGAPSAPVQVQLHDSISVTVLGDTPICEGTSSGLAAVASGGDGGPYIYTWNQGAGVGQNQTVSPTQTTVYTVTVTDGCETPANSDSVTITVFPLPTVNFSFSGEPAVTFTNLTSGVGNIYFWNFGDGNTSTSVDPTNTYTSTGTYTVCLTVTSAEGCTDSICKSVLITTVGVDENELNNVTIYPNPITNNQITIGNENNELLTISILNVIGQKVWSGTISKSETINFPELQKGNYFVKITSSDGSVTKKLIVQ